MKNDKQIQMNKKKFILIDFENILTFKGITRMNKDFIKIILFVGAHQKIKDDIISLLQELFKENIHFFMVRKSGKNSLDFHLTYYLGKLTKENPDDLFYILSKDKGYDPLINFMQTMENIKIWRFDNYSNISLKAIPVDEQIKQISASTPIVQKPEAMNTLLEAVY